MFLFRKKQTLEESGFFRGFIDWHCHILPGVDDGVQTMEEALQILAAYERLEVKEVWLTPHVMEDIPNTTGFLKEKFRELQDAYKGNIRLHLSSENMLDSLFEERLAKNDFLPFGPGGDHLLVETSYYNPPMGLQNLLLRIRMKGYFPVLAHPERYAYMERDRYNYLKTMGVKFQLNLFSLAGTYGDRPRHIAHKLLEQKMYDFAGSDLRKLEMLNDFLQKDVRKIKGGNIWQRMG